MPDESRARDLAVLRRQRESASAAEPRLAAIAFVASGTRRIHRKAPRAARGRPSTKPASDSRNVSGIPLQRHYKRRGLLERCAAPSLYLRTARQRHPAHRPRISRPRNSVVDAPPFLRRPTSTQILSEGHPGTAPLAPEPAPIGDGSRPSCGSRGHLDAYQSPIAGPEPGAPEPEAAVRGDDEVIVENYASTAMGMSGVSSARRSPVRQ